MESKPETELLNVVASHGLHTEEGKLARSKLYDMGFSDNMINMYCATHNISKLAPKGGLIRAIKKRFFKPKTNWNRVSAIAAIAALFMALLIYYSQRM